MFQAEDNATIHAAAERRSIAPAALLAVIEVESGGRLSARIGDRDEPLIRWEGHYFDRLCPVSVRGRARALGLASPQAGAVRNPPSQAERWALLERAATIDRSAAYASTSWGIGQVMGEHWRWLGYDSVDALVAEARSGLAGQLALMLRYIDKAGLLPALRAHEWEAFARGYNGPGFRRHGYHTRIAAAYRRHAASAPAASSAVVILRHGDRGHGVAELQEMLGRAGHATTIDGIFGSRTEAAVRAFQRHAGLAVDGIAGPLTLGALQPPAAHAFSGLATLWRRIQAWSAP